MKITFKPVSKFFSNKLVLDNLCFPSFNSGNMVSILGVNGAGKSSFLKEIILQTVKKNSFVMLNDQMINEKDIGMLSQEYKINYPITVLELLITTLNVNNKSLYAKQNTMNIVMDILNSLNIIELANENVSSLSGGQSQLIGLAQAILKKPKLLILDEPTSALDIRNQFIIMKYIRSYIKNNDIFGLMVVHDLNLSIQFSDYIAVFKNGKVFDFGKPSDVINEKSVRNVFNVRAKVYDEDNILSIKLIDAV